MRTAPNAAIPLTREQTVAIYWGPEDKMQETPIQAGFLELTSFAEDSHARMSQWQDAARDWLESGADSGLSSTAFLQSCNQLGSSLRTSLVFCRRTEDGIWEPSSGGWGTSGIGGPMGCWTLNGSEWPNGGDGCSLSEVLETDVAPTYYLSPRACAGILRRAERRGKTLPPMLHQALLSVAAEQPELASPEDRTLSSSPGEGGTAGPPTR